MALLRQRSLRFPEGFLWGTASSSHQCEGGNNNNQWYRWEEAGHIRTGERCLDAANWWREAEDDFALAEQMENNALRLSIEWSRIEPSEGYWNSAAIDRYRQMLTDLHRRHIKPLVTLCKGPKSALLCALCNPCGKEPARPLRFLDHYQRAKYLCRTRLFTRYISPRRSRFNARNAGAA